MAIDDDEPAVARRVRTRRNRGAGFSRGQATHTESLRASARQEDYEDDVDDAIDPERVHDHVQQVAARPPQPLQIASPDTADPRRRMQEVQQAGDASYAQEYRLSMLHRLLLRKVPIDQIARELGVSISTVQKDRVKLKKHLRDIARSLDIDEMVGGQTGLYDEITGMALRLAGQATGDNAVPVAMRLAAARTALAANADKNRFYAASGVLDVLRFRRQEDGTSMSDIQLLMEDTQRMLSLLASGDDAMGFGLNDADDDEVMTL